MLTDQNIVIQHIAVFMLIFVRVSTFFLVAPPFNTNGIPQRVRILLSLFVSFITLSILPSLPHYELFSFLEILMLLKQILLGLITAFVFRIVFEVFNAAGSLTALQTGLGFASLIDPQTHMQTAVISQIYHYAAFLLFLVLNGHLALIQLIVDSFKTMPLTDLSLPLTSIKSIVDFSGTIFSDAVFVALPAGIALLVVQLAFALMASVAPTLNIISVGFPILLSLGFIIIYLGLPNVINYMPVVFERGFIIAGAIFKGP